MAGPRYGARPVYFTDVIVRHDHPARAFADLRGATWSFNNPGSHSGYNVVRHHLLELGETRGFFGRVVCGGSHQGSIQLVLDGEIDAAGVDCARPRDSSHRPPAGAGDRAPHDRRPRAEPHSARVVPARARPAPRRRASRALLLGMSGRPRRAAPSSPRA